MGKLQRTVLLDCSRRHSYAIMCTAYPAAADVNNVDVGGSRMTLTASPEWPATGRVHARPLYHDGERRGQGGGNDAVDATTSERGSA